METVSLTAGDMEWLLTSKNLDAMSSYTELCFANSKAMLSLRAKSGSQMGADEECDTYMFKQ
jgi:hypothetical protein